MECPHCHKELPGKNCSHCGVVIPVESQYCMDCGAPVEEEAGVNDQQDDLDFENRILCPDGTCTGIIIDGKCSECGKP